MANSESYTEVDAMRDIDAALGKLDPSARERVMDWASSKHGLRSRATVDGKEADPEIVGADGPRPKDLKSFLATKAPQSFYERVACLVYYLEKFDGRSEVSTQDITKANSDARQSKLTNPATFVKHATHTHGYLISIKKGIFAISPKGEAVVEAMPDRAKADEAHKKFKVVRKVKKRKTSTTKTKK